MLCTSGVLSTTADIFMSEVVHLIRSHQIHTVELVSAREVPSGKGSAGKPSSSSVLILVEARLKSALTWQQNASGSVKRKNGSGTAEKENTFQDAGTVLTYHISFLLLKSVSASMVPIAVAEEAASNADSISPFSFPQTVLSAWWCAQLQRRLAICSALTGLPVSLSISLLPYVPHLTWERGHDGILGAAHCATMMSTLDEKNERSGSRGFAGHAIRVAMLLNANIPLGPQGGCKTAVLLLHAVDGDVCFAASLSCAVMPRKQRKRLRAEGRHSTEVANTCEENELLFPLLLRFSQSHLLPILPWRVVGSRPLLNNSGHDDVCGLWDQMGCSFYLDGTLDAQSVQSITVIVDAPLMLWRHLIECDASLELETDEASRGLLHCIAETAEGVLSRLAAENVDFFLRRLPLSPAKDEKEGERAVNSATCEERHSKRQSSLPFVQCIADSLAQIVRTSKNRSFVAEVHRLLRLHQEEGAASLLSSDRNDMDGVEDDAAAAIPPSLVSETAAQLRWAVEARLLE